MTRRAPARSVGVALLLTLVAACASRGPTGTASVSPTESPDRLFGRLVRIERTEPAVVVALADFLGGEEANAAARADGVIGPTEQLPNPFYIQDRHDERTLPLDLSATIAVHGWDAEGNIVPKPISLEAFVAGLPDGPASGEWMTTGWYWFDVRDGRVTAIEAQYLP